MRQYYALTKPGIVWGNLITAAAGFLLASKSFQFGSFFALMMGLALIMAAACVMNNYIDRDYDQKMKRTKERAIATGVVSTKQALLFAGLLLMAGNLVLFFGTTLFALLIANVGFCIYVLLYSIWKPHTVYATAIGSIAGACPAVAGYCAARSPDLGALLLFLMMILWQMPHFLAIAVNHIEDYATAGIPVFPLVKGMPDTKKRMAYYILGFMLITPLFTFFEYTGYTYLVITTLMGLVWLFSCVQGTKQMDTHTWGKSMFRLSLIVVSVTCFMIFVDRV